MFSYLLQMYTLLRNAIQSNGPDTHFGASVDMVYVGQWSKWASRGFAGVGGGGLGGGAETLFASNWRVIYLHTCVHSESESNKKHNRETKTKQPKACIINARFYSAQQGNRTDVFVMLYQLHNRPRQNCLGSLCLVWRPLSGYTSGCLCVRVCVCSSCGFLFECLMYII